MQELPSLRMSATPLVSSGTDVAPRVHCVMRSASNALTTVEFVHLMQDSTAARRDSQHRSGAHSEVASRSPLKDKRVGEAIIES
jgi:hypothetical protein